MSRRLTVTGTVIASDGSPARSGRSRSPCRGRGSVVWTGRDASGRARCCPDTPAASGWVVPALKDRGFTVVSLVHELPNLIQEYGLQQARQNIASRSDHVVFSSSMGRSRFCQGFPVPAERSLVRAQGLYREITYSASARGRVAAELGLPIECRIIVGIGYGDLRKGVDLFVRAAFTLKDHPLAPQFVWVGALDPAVRTWLASDVQRGRYREPPRRSSH